MNDEIIVGYLPNTELKLKIISPLWDAGNIYKYTLNTKFSKSASISLTKPTQNSSREYKKT